MKVIKGKIIGILKSYGKIEELDIKSGDIILACNVSNYQLKEVHIGNEVIVSIEDFPYIHELGHKVYRTKGDININGTTYTV